VLLLVLSIVAIAAMQLTTLEYHMSANSANLSKARQVSESARMAVSSILPDHVYRRSWAGITKATGLEIKDKDNDGDGGDLLYGGNSECANDCFDPEVLDEDAIFAEDLDDADNDNDPFTGTDLSASVAVYGTESQFDRGAGIQMVAGYAGLGKGAAGGGTVLHFYVRAEGEAARHARATTSSDVRARVLN
jgi:hypothetical protein